MAKVHDEASMQALLALQKAAQLRDGAPSAEKRIERLDRCIGLLVDNQKAIADALNADFGVRSREATAFTDVAASIGPLKHAKANLKRWMKTERRPTRRRCSACSAPRPRSASSRRAWWA